MNEARKIQALRRIQEAIYLAEQATPRACGLKEAEIRELLDEGLVECWISGDSGEFVDDHTVRHLTPQGLGLLMSAPPEALRVTLQTEKKGILESIVLFVVKRFWAVLLVVIGAIVTAAATSPGEWLWKKILSYFYP